MYAKMCILLLFSFFLLLCSFTLLLDCMHCRIISMRALLGTNSTKHCNWPKHTHTHTISQWFNPFHIQAYWFCRLLHYNMFPFCLGPLQCGRLVAATFSNIQYRSVQVDWSTHTHTHSLHREHIISGWLVRFADERTHSMGLFTFPLAQFRAANRGNKKQKRSKTKNTRNEWKKKNNNRWDRGRQCKIENVNENVLAVFSPQSRSYVLGSANIYKHKSIYKHFRILLFCMPHCFTRLLVFVLLFSYFPRLLQKHNKHMANGLLNAELLILAMRGKVATTKQLAPAEDRECFVCVRSIERKRAR